MKKQKKTDLIGQSTTGLKEAIDNAMKNSKNQNNNIRYEIIEASFSDGGNHEKQYEVKLAVLSQRLTQNPKIEAK